MPQNIQIGEAWLVLLCQNRVLLVPNTQFLLSEYLHKETIPMQFSNEYVGASGGEIYGRSENAQQQVITEMGDSFYEFLNTFSIQGNFVYRWSCTHCASFLEIKSPNASQTGTRRSR